MGGIASRSSPAFRPDPGPIEVGSVGQVLTVGAGGIPAFAAAAGGGFETAFVPNNDIRAPAAPAESASLVFPGLPAGAYSFEAFLLLSTSVADGITAYPNAVGASPQNSWAYQNMPNASGNVTGQSRMPWGAGGAATILNTTSNAVTLYGVVVFTNANNRISIYWGANAGTLQGIMTEGSWCRILTLA